MDHRQKPQWMELNKNSVYLIDLSKRNQPDCIHHQLAHSDGYEHSKRRWDCHEFEICHVTFSTCQELVFIVLSACFVLILVLTAIKQKLHRIYTKLNSNITKKNPVNTTAFIMTQCSIDCLRHWCKYEKHLHYLHKHEKHLHHRCTYEKKRLCYRCKNETTGSISEVWHFWRQTIF